MHKEISFIIPHKGRVDMLTQTIESIAKQQTDLSCLEVIIASHSHDLGSEIFDVPEQLIVKIVHIDNTKTISASRNIGVTHATGSFFAFLDADIYLSSNWVNCMSELLENESSRVIVSAMQVCTESAPPLEQLRTHLSNADLDTNVNFLPGRNLFMRRETFDKIGGFPEHLITCEDYYFTDKATDFGNLYYSSEASYIHLGEDKVFSEMFTKEKWRGQSNLQSISGRKIPLREIPSFVIPIIICFSMFLAGLTAIAGIWPAATLFLMLGLGPLLIYSVRVYKISKGQLDWSVILTFYMYYFPARAYGTIAGLFKSIGANHK